MKRWKPNTTVACVIERDGQYLMVEEEDHGRQVISQPAGHLEKGESITDAARREALEETGWEVELTGLIGVYRWHLERTDTTFLRFTFAAKALREVPDATIDPDIDDTHWLTLNELKIREAEMRSPIVLRCIDDYLNKPSTPISLITDL